MSVINTNKFYNVETITKLQDIEKRKSNNELLKKSPKMPLSILKPPMFWMEFKKQVDALNMASKESNDYNMFCTFVYQKDNGCRKFVVAHPEIYWWYYKHRSEERRCSYEVIPENHPCRLYLDLEYSIEINSEKNGPFMTNLLIDIFCAYLLEHWRVPCNRYNVINLDSSTNEKFSRHVIFNVKNIAFKDNYHVGKLVKLVCNDILHYITFKEKEHNILSYFDRSLVERLIVKTKKGKELFVDTSVYTKNRHFRIYKSTKWGKQSNLTIANDCQYIPFNTTNDKELNLFLDSLISYFVMKKDLILLECLQSGAVNTKCFKEEEHQYNYEEKNNVCSKYPMLDKYIHSMIYPGKIRLCKYFEDIKLLVYEILGYRYCENIDRWHKSNNIFLVVNLKNNTIYQKCHDQDCFGFKSKPKQLPEEICFQIDEEGDTFLTSAIENIA